MSHRCCAYEHGGCRDVCLNTGPGQRAKCYEPLPPCVLHGDGAGCRSLHCFLGFFSAALLALSLCCFGMIPQMHRRQGSSICLKVFYDYRTHLHTWLVSVILYPVFVIWCDRNVLLQKKTNMFFCSTLSSSISLFKKLDGFGHDIEMNSRKH